MTLPILCRKCGAEGTARCSLPGCPLPPQPLHEIPDPTDIKGLFHRVQHERFMARTRREEWREDEAAKHEREADRLIAAYCADRFDGSVREDG